MRMYKVKITFIGILLTLLYNEALALATDTIPQGFNYQGILRDVSGDEATNESITIRGSVQADTGSLADVHWQETHFVQTNEFGLFNIVVGQGTYLGGLQINFKDIPWTAFNMVMKIEVDRGSGFEDMGINMLLSVPYALVSGNGQGPPGQNGNDGSSSLIDITTLLVGDPNCPYGGSRIQSGIDANSNVTYPKYDITFFVCFFSHIFF